MEESVGATKRGASPPASVPTPSSKIPPQVIPLGGYLHPRDMRRMVTPFSVSNEPALIVRRHVMLLNFDPFRAIVLRDRLLFLVPDGADEILTSLEKRVRGGVAEAENEVFGDSNNSLESISRNSSLDNLSKIGNSVNNDFSEDGEIEDMAFELVCLDAVIQSVTQELGHDFDELNNRVNDVMEVRV